MLPSNILKRAPLLGHYYSPQWTNYFFFSSLLYCETKVTKSFIEFQKKITQQQQTWSQFVRFTSLYIRPNNKQSELRGFSDWFKLCIYPGTVFNNGWRLKYGHMLLVHVGIYREPTEGWKIRHFLVGEEEEAIRIHRCSTGGDKYHHDCFCIDKPSLIKGALGGDADKVAPSEWNDKLVEYHQQTDCVKVFLAGSRWRSRGGQQATAGDTLDLPHTWDPDWLNFLKE